jgi:hypothetical protein
MRHPCFRDRSFSLVVGVQIAPIPRPMAGQVTKGILADFLQEF